MKTELPTTWSATSGDASPRPRWLIVDDCEEILEILEILLKRLAPVEIRRAHSGAEALALFGAERFAFVVTDLDMPGMNGIELCRELHAAAPAVPVLLATGSAKVSADAARGLGFCGMLAKPFSPADLQQAVSAAGVLENDSTISNRATALAA